jgi:hypothetical protein
LSAEELADAHSCFVGTALAMCAGGKAMMTGISMDSAMHGIWLLNPAVKDYRDDPAADFSVDVVASYRQPAEGASPAWSKTWYVMTDSQLARMIARARKDSKWQPGAFAQYR